MRQFTTVVDQVLAKIPLDPPAELKDELNVLASELRILRRAGSYTAPEAADDADLWARLATACYRYLPKPSSYAFAQEISTIITGI